MVLIVIFQDKHNLDQMNYNYITGLLKLILPKQLISLVTRLFGFFVQDVKSHSGVIFDPKNKFEGNEFCKDWEVAANLGNKTALKWLNLENCN